MLANLLYYQNGISSSSYPDYINQMPPSALYMFLLIAIGTSQVQFLPPCFVEFVMQFQATIDFIYAHHNGRKPLLHSPSLPHSRHCPPVLRSLDAAIEDYLCTACCFSDCSCLGVFVDQWCISPVPVANSCLRMRSVVAGHPDPKTRGTALPSPLLCGL